MAEPCRLMICGSRTLTGRFWHIKPWLDEFARCNPVGVVIVGDEPLGPDDAARRWALARKIKLEVFEADWSKGKSGGPLRNQRMIEEGKPNFCIAFWDGRSPGTKDAITRATQAGVTVTILPGNMLYGKEANGRAAS